MNVVELSTLLQSMGAPADAYSIGADRNEAYCLLPEAGRWHVYYSERGNRNNESVLAKEAEACQALIDALMRDGMVRPRIQPNEG